MGKKEKRKARKDEDKQRKAGREEAKLICSMYFMRCIYLKITNCNYFNNVCYLVHLYAKLHIGWLLPRKWTLAT